MQIKTPERPHPENGAFSPPSTPMAKKTRKCMMGEEESKAFKVAMTRIALAAPTLNQSFPLRRQSSEGEIISMTYRVYTSDDEN